MVGDPSLISETSPSFWHLAQRCSSVRLAGTTVQGLLAVTKHHLPCIYEKSQAMSLHILMRK